MTRLAEVIRASRDLLDIQTEKSESPDEQHSWPGSPLQEAEMAAQPVASRAPSEPSSSSSSCAEMEKTMLDRQVDAWLQQERVKNLVQPYSRSPSSHGGESLLYRESLARMELDESKSQASSDGQLPLNLPCHGSVQSGSGDSLLCREAKARSRPDEQKASPQPCDSVTTP